MIDTRDDKLTVVTSRFNPIGYQAPETHYKAFVEHMLDSGVRLVVVECAYGGRPFVCEMPHILHVPVRARTWTFCKENLLNIGIARVPDAKFIAWIDSDIFFRDPGWTDKTVQALHHYPIIQPWSECYDLGPNGQHGQLHRSFAKLYHQLEPVGPTAWKAPYTFPHPGFAWACQRDFLEAAGGLFDLAAMGSGDHHMAYALLGQVAATVPTGATQAYTDALTRWQKRADRFVNRKIGYTGGTIEHRFHGSKKSRGYQDRWQIFTRNQFDPIVDLIRNTNLVIEWAGNKPRLEHEFDLYLRGRNEDCNAW